MVLSNQVTAMANMLSKLDEDHQAAGRLLLRKLNGVRSSLGGPTSSPGAMAPLSTSMAIVDDHSNHCGTLGDLLQEHRELKNEHSNLKVDFESLSAAVTAQGGQVLDGLGFASKAMVCILVVQECPRGNAFEVFLDVTSLFCCDSMYSPASGWEKLTRGMEDGFSPTARKVVTSYSQPHCSWYMDEKPVVVGKLLPAFKDADCWNGVGGMDGRRNKIETSAATSAEIAHWWISDKLPAGGKLAPLALKMVDRTVEWVHTVHKHLDMELLRLTQLHISKEESLILLLEGVIIMYARIHDVQKHMMEFTTHINKVEYMVQCIWMTLQVHRVMQEFVQGGLKSHPAIGSAFIRFLTKQTGNNVALGVGVQLRKLTEFVSTIKNLAKMADLAAKDAAKVAKEANTCSSVANTSAKKAKDNLKTLYTKNLTLKRCPPSCEGLTPTLTRCPKLQAALTKNKNSTRLCILAELLGVTAPFTVLVLAKRWPSVLISVLALYLPLVAAYFPVQFHWYFKPRDNVMTWQLPSSFKAAVMPVGVAVLLSGSIDFLD